MFKTGMTIGAIPMTLSSTIPVVFIFIKEKLNLNKKKKIKENKKLNTQVVHPLLDAPAI